MVGADPGSRQLIHTGDVSYKPGTMCRYRPQGLWLPSELQASTRLYT